MQERSYSLDISSVKSKQLCFSTTEREERVVVGVRLRHLIPLYIFSFADADGAWMKEELDYELRLGQ